MPIHMTYDDVLEKVEKDPVGALLGGQLPLNPQYQAVLDKYVPVGVILEKFFGMQGASKDPKLQYVRDPFWFQSLQMQMQAQMAQQQQQQQGAAGRLATVGVVHPRTVAGEGEKPQKSSGDEGKGLRRGFQAGYWRRHGQCPSEW